MSLSIFKYNTSLSTMYMYVHANFQPNRICTSVDIALWKIAPLMWRHVTTNDVIMTKSLNECAKFKVDQINKTSQSGA